MKIDISPFQRRLREETMTRNEILNIRKQFIIDHFNRMITSPVKALIAGIIVMAVAVTYIVAFIAALLSGHIVPVIITLLIPLLAGSVIFLMLTKQVKLTPIQFSHITRKLNMVMEQDSRRERVFSMIDDMKSTSETLFINDIGWDVAKEQSMPESSEDYEPLSNEAVMRFMIRWIETYDEWFVDRPNMTERYY